ncbi:hypothetical protein [Thiomicrorhabdus lithotrophica]|uniref:Phage abortive infection protein n=1 Tax=Thiomicrorhabdus lithotrophica TaxID=2949997 RepID=A0ABY8CDU9_9GAMM|nr:hypothetical protein [Thiomicrorhabdus lithotrophica]WEJ63422.1 hypothetical protein NR989_03990 [Thiomicrorhabdus lithotrophica]
MKTYNKVAIWTVLILSLILFTIFFWHLDFSLYAENLFGFNEWQITNSIQPGLDIATSVSVIVAVIIFVVSISYEKSRERLAQKNQFKIEILKQALNRFYELEKRTTHSLKKVENKLFNYQVQIQMIGHHLYLYLYEKDEVIRKHALESMKVENTINEVLNVYVKKASEDLVLYDYASLASMNIADELRKIHEDVEVFEQEIKIDPFIQWVLGADKFLTLISGLNNFLYEYESDFDGPGHYPKWHIRGAITDLDMYRSMSNNFNNDYDLKVSMLNDYLEDSQDVLKLYLDGLKELNICKQVLINEVKLLLD